MTNTSLYHKTELPGGLRIVSEQMPSVRSVALGIWVTVGSRHETETTSGISHFIEHMAFKGTQNRSALDIARAIEQGGGYVNAFTGKELTCFFVHVLDEQLPTAIEILSDILANSLFAPEEIEKEKQVILDEIRDLEDSPDELTHERFARALFAPHSLSRPILGSPQNVSSFTRDDLIQFIGSHYVPNRVVVAAAGNVDHNRLIELVEAKLKLPKGVPEPDGVVPSAVASKIAREQRAIQQAHVCLGGRGLKYRDDRRYALSVLVTALGGGMSSRLFQNIREKHGMTYAIYAFADMLSDTGVLGVYLATDASRVDKAIELVHKELYDLRQTSLLSDDLKGVKTQLKGNIMLGLEQVSNRMNRVAKMEIYLGKPVDLAEISQRIDAVTERQVKDLADELFNEEKLITIILEPENSIKSN